MTIDGDTTITPLSRESVLFAAGAVKEAVDMVMDDGNGIRKAFCAVRPPGFLFFGFVV